MLTRILVPGVAGASTPETPAYEAPYGLVRGEPS
jgi:hypothetical protein